MTGVQTCALPILIRPIGAVGGFLFGYDTSVINGAVDAIASPDSGFGLNAAMSGFSVSSAMGFTTPFKSFSDVKSDNPLVQAAVEDQNSGKTAVSWNFTMMPSEEWKNKLGSALLEYAQGTGDWNAVKTAFVDGWKTEYDAAH